MIIVKPLTVTESNLTASNILENDAPDWTPSTPYDLGDEVIFDHRVYESLEGANESQPDEGAIAESPSWLDLGPTNRYRMWDAVPAPQSIRAGNIDVTVTPESTINAVGLINVNANSVTVQVIDSVDGVVYSQTRSLQDVSEITDWYSYFFEPITVKNDLVFLDLPNYASPVRVIVNAGSGTASVGEVVLGRQQELGCTQYGSSLGLRDYSRVEQDDFGNYDITRRRFSKTFDYDVIVERDSTATVQRALTRVRSTATLFIGKEDREETIIYGFYRDMQIVLTQPTFVDMSVECESLPYEEIEAIFDGGAVSTPTITQPENGFTVPEGGSFRSSQFAAVPNSDAHESSSWQIATDAAFASVVHEDLASVTDLVEWTPDWGYLVESTEYYVRVLHRGTTFGDSSWSTGVMFIAGPELAIDTPSITSPEDGDTFARSLNITSSAFSYTSEVVTAHEATQWQIATDAGFTMLEYDDVSESSLTTLAVPSSLTNGDTLYVRCRYRDSYGIFSSYSTGVEFVVGEPLGQIVRTSIGASSITVPAGVTRVSVLVIGSGSFGWDTGAGGNGGSYAYADAITVTPGEVIPINVGGLGATFGRTRFRDDATLWAYYPTNSIDPGFGGAEVTGGVAAPFISAGSGAGLSTGEARGGGGAAGIAGNGAFNDDGYGGNGGGIGLLLQGSPGEDATGTSGANGTGGLGGEDGQATRGGRYGGGGGGAPHNSGNAGRQSGQGAVRIIYGQLPNGTYRAYPSTGVADM